MFVTSSQIYIFIACVGAGSFIGILFSLSKILKSKINNVMLKSIPDIVAFVIGTVIFILLEYNMNFPNIRLYMFLGVFVGIVAYLKSFHILLAKILKKAYNIIKRKKVKTKDDRCENKKIDSSCDRGCGITRNNTRVNNALSTYRHKFGKKSSCRVK